MPREKADFPWYSSQSRKQGLPPRCPIARADLCPRYFWSNEALTTGRHFTEIPRDRAAPLAKKWEVFHAEMDEDKPWTQDEPDRDGTMGSPRELQIVAHFCPEVSYKRFEYFASDLVGYIGDEDERSHERHCDSKDYEREGIGKQYDPNWERVTPCHYTECSEFSIYSGFAPGKGLKKLGARGPLNPKRRFEVFVRDNYTCVYCGRKPPEVVLHVDHKVSVHDGGSDDLANLVTACEECNAGKGRTSL